jgi:hypothetical protein
MKIHIQQYADGRWGFDDYSQGERVRVRCITKQKAMDRAMDATVLLKNGRHDLLGIDASRLAKFLKWESASKVSPSVAEACKAFIALKSNKSSRHLESLQNDLALFEKFVGS